jgi:hypothetical protein
LLRTASGGVNGAASVFGEVSPQTVTYGKHTFARINFFSPWEKPHALLRDIGPPA